MDVSRPYAVFSSSVDARILAVLAGADSQFTGREVARLADEPQTSTRRALDRLAEHGLVLTQRAGRAVLYSLNRDHLAAPALIELVQLRTSLLEKLRDEFTSWAPPPHHASIFGSTARGDGDTRSDIDLFIVRRGEVDEEHSDWRTQVDRLAERVHSWTGNHAGIAEVSEEELEHLRSSRPAVVAELEADAIDLAGEPLRKILSRA